MILYRQLTSWVTTNPVIYQHAYLLKSWNSSSESIDQQFDATNLELTTTSWLISEENRISCKYAVTSSRLVCVLFYSWAFATFLIQKKLNAVRFCWKMTNFKSRHFLLNFFFPPNWNILHKYGDFDTIFNRSFQKDSIWRNIFLL